jgi:hypothetical protein
MKRLSLRILDAVRLSRKEFLIMTFRLSSFFRRVFISLAEIRETCANEDETIRINEKNKRVFFTMDTFNSLQERTKKSNIILRLKGFCKSREGRENCINVLVREFLVGIGSFNKYCKHACRPAKSHITWFITNHDGF